MRRARITNPRAGLTFGGQTAPPGSTLAELHLHQDVDVPTLLARLRDGHAIIELVGEAGELTTAAVTAGKPKGRRQHAAAHGEV